jgi:hypothetical protein
VIVMAVIVEPARRIDAEIADLADWRGEMLAGIRKTIHDADPDVTEEWKWMGTPVWSHDGNVCAADAHKNVVKMIFFKGARLPDPHGLFNAELGGTTRRAIKFFQGDRIDERALTQLVRAGVDLNRADADRPRTTRRSTSRAGMRVHPRSDPQSAHRGLRDPLSGPAESARPPRRDRAGDRGESTAHRTHRSNRRNAGHRHQAGAHVISAHGPSRSAISPPSPPTYAIRFGPMVSGA